MNEHLGFGSTSHQIFATDDHAQGTTPQPGTPEIDEDSLGPSDPLGNIVRHRIHPFEASDEQQDSYLLNPGPFVSHVIPPQLERDPNDAEMPSDLQHFIPPAPAATSSSSPPSAPIVPPSLRSSRSSAIGGPEHSSRSSSTSTRSTDSASASAGALSTRPRSRAPPRSLWNSTVNIVLWTPRQLLELAWFSLRLPAVCLFLLRS